WLPRRLPIFAIPGTGKSRVRPVHVDDVARLCVETRGGTVDAVGPEVFTFEEMVGLVRHAVGSRALLVHVPPVVVPLLTGLLGLLVGDVVLTADELRGLMDELVTPDGPATGRGAASCAGTAAGMRRPRPAGSTTTGRRRGTGRRPGPAH